MKKRLLVLSISVAMIFLIIITKGTYATSNVYSRKELQNMVTSTAISYLYNNEYSNYNAKAGHPSFSYRNLKNSPEMVSRSNRFHIDCSSFVTSVYRYSLNYDFGEYYSLSPGFLYDFTTGEQKNSYDSIQKFRETYLIHNRGFGVDTFFKTVTAQKKNSSSKKPYISNLESNVNPVVYYYENENVDGAGTENVVAKTSIQNSLTSREKKDGVDAGSYDFVKRLKPGDIIVWDGHVMLYVGNSLDKDTTGIIHSDGYDDYFVNDSGEIRVNSDDNSIRYNSINYIINKLNQNPVDDPNKPKKALTYIAILRPINILCRNNDANNCSSEYINGDVNVKVSEQASARDEFSDLKIEQYYEANSIKEGGDYENRTLTKTNVVNQSDSITYNIELKNMSTYGYCDKLAGGINYLKQSNCEANRTEENKAEWKMVNREQKNYNGMIVTGQIPANTSFLNCTGNCSYNKETGEVRWDNINVDVAEEKKLSYTVRVEAEKKITNKGMTITHNEKTLQLGKLETIVDSSINNKINLSIFNEYINKFKARVDNNTIVYTSSANENYKKDLNDESSKIALGSFAFAKSIYYNALGIDLDSVTPTTIKNAFFKKVEKDSDTYAYIVNNNIDDNYKKMLVPGLYGGRLLYGVDQNVGITSTSSGLYELKNANNYRTQYADINNLEIGDIIITYDESNATYMYCGKDSQGKNIIIRWINGNFEIYDVNGEKTAQRIYKEMFGHDLFVVIRPLSLYGTTINLKGIDNNNNFYVTNGKYRNLIRPENKNITINLEYDAIKCSVTDCPSTLTVNNAIFDGWYSDKNYINKLENETKLISNNYHELYAKWQSDEVILPNPNVLGYKLNGWYDDVNFTNRVALAGEKYIPSNDITLYANYEAIEYEIEYNSNGGIGTMSNSHHVYDVDKKLDLNTFSKEGYIFKGWSTTLNGKVVYSDGQTVKNLIIDNNEKVILYAVWGKIVPNIDADFLDEYNVIYNLKLNSTYDNLFENVTDISNVVIKSKTGEIISSENIVKTTDVVSFKFNNTHFTYDISVLGDVAPDGSLNVGDISSLYQSIKGKIKLDKLCELAGDVTNDDSLNVADVSKLYQYLKKRISSLD